jgi:hypothetical protein
MSSTDNSQKKPMGYSPEELKHLEKLLQLKIKCGGCDQLIDRTEILDSLNGLNNPNLEPIVVDGDRVFHNETCMYFAMCNYPVEIIQAANPHVDPKIFERMYDSDRMALIKEFDRIIKRLPRSTRN